MIAAILLGATAGLVIYAWQQDRALKRQRRAQDHWRRHPCAAGAVSPDQPCHVHLLPPWRPDDDVDYQPDDDVDQARRGTDLEVEQ